MDDKPKYPITVLLKEESKIESYHSEIDLVTSLEWFDSSAPEWQAKVIDVSSREVVLKIEALKILELRFK